jgi:hypothetical protein
MNDNPDLREWLDDWPYDAENVVRIVRVSDGREIMQVRTPLGIEQYELEGRPDGQRPHGMQSVLDYHLSCLAKLKESDEEDTFLLRSEECSELFDEGVIYYCRYLHLFQIKDWERTIRDTARNLRLFDFIHRYGARQEDRMQLEQWRSYVIRMNAIAKAMLLSDAQDFDGAQKIVKRAIASIESLPAMDNPNFAFERKRSLEALKEVAVELITNRPQSKLERLEQELRQAVESQEFERAAELRDKIRALRETGG